MTQAELTGLAPDFLHHGGRVDDARRIYPDAPQPWLDLSTGINPAAWSPHMTIVVDSAPLPTTVALADLEAAAARYFGVAAHRVAAVPGSEVALRLLGALGLKRPIVAVRPGYGTHRDVADTVIDADAIDEADAGGTILLANPNNPDGRVIDSATLVRLATRQESRDGWLVIDEAFADATPDVSILAALNAAAPVIVMRSFGKFFGLAGVRLGFMVGPPSVIHGVRRLLGDWPVSAQAIAWGLTAYSDAAWIATTRQSLAAAAARLDTLLARHGLAAGGASPLFRLVEHPDARAIFDRLVQAGILTRPFADRADWLRLGLPGDDAAFHRLDRALADG